MIRKKLGNFFQKANINNVKKYSCWNDNLALFKGISRWRIVCALPWLSWHLSTGIFSLDICGISIRLITRDARNRIACENMKLFLWTLKKKPLLNRMPGFHDNVTLEVRRCGCDYGRLWSLTSYIWRDKWQKQIENQAFDAVRFVSTHSRIRVCVCVSARAWIKYKCVGLS